MYVGLSVWVKPVQQGKYIYRLTFQEDKDLEWKYGLTVLYMDYIQHCSTLPSPVNLIPNPRWIIYYITGHKCDNCVKSQFHIKREGEFIFLVDLNSQVKQGLNIF